MATYKTVRKSGKRVLVVSKGKAPYVPPVLPDKPKVTVGTRSYGRTKTGAYIVCRFWITQFWRGKYVGKTKPTDPWFVIDMEEARLAKGTSQTGYSKEDATRVAREYRDKYGAWSTVPF